MDNIIQLICTVAIGLQLVILLAATILYILPKSKSVMVLMGIVGILFSVIYIIIAVMGILYKTNIRLEFIDAEYYTIYDNMLIWAIVLFGIVVSIFASISGLRRKKTVIEQVAPAPAFPREEVEPVTYADRGDVFKGLDCEGDIESFLGLQQSDDSLYIQQKQKDLKKLEKLLK